MKHLFQGTFNKKAAENQEDALDSVDPICGRPELVPVVDNVFV